MISKNEIEHWIVNIAGVQPTPDNHFDAEPNVTTVLNLKIQQRPSELAGLVEFLLNKKENNESLEYYAEIGACSGATTYVLNHFLNFKELLIVDDNGKSLPSFYVERGNLDRQHVLTWIPRIEIIGSSQDANVIQRVKQLAEHQKYDILFIDGDHSYDGVKNDVLEYYDIVRDNGYIIFHDVISHPDISIWLIKMTAHLPDLIPVAVFAERGKHSDSYPQGIGLGVYQKKPKEQV